MIAIVDYEAGNLTSVQLALNEIGFPGVITSDREMILNAERVIFPGVGAAGACMFNIHIRNLQNILKEFLETKKPFLGICVGAQIVLDSSLENDNTSCLGFISGTTGKFESTPQFPIKVPQIGWNQVEVIKDNPLFTNIPQNSDFYFVHSYYPIPTNKENCFASTQYGNTKFTSVIGKENLLACQFHPEKSGKYGLQLLKNFCEWNGNW